MLESTERMRIVALKHGQIPENWPTYEEFVGLAGNESVVKTRREPNPVWKDEYGYEEVMGCLDESE
jgi:hypothetical protein